MCAQSRPTAVKKIFQKYRNKERKHEEIEQKVTTLRKKYTSTAMRDVLAAAVPTESQSHIDLSFSSTAEGTMPPDTAVSPKPSMELDRI